MKTEASTPLLRPADTAVPAAARAMLATASHEIRAPVHTVLGMSELLAQTTLTSSQRQYVDALRRAASSLAVLLDDIFDLGKLQRRGPDQLRQERFWLPDLIARVVEVAEPHVRPGVGSGAGDRVGDGSTDLGGGRGPAGEHPLRPTLSVTTTERTPKSLVGDPVRLQQVLVNLVANALQYTPTRPGGGGAVAFHIDGQADGADAHLVFTVRDDGPGISADRLALVFEPWERLPEHSHLPGLGIGLTITRRLVDAMGGTIDVESRVAGEAGGPAAGGTGSMFRVSVTLPLARGATQAMTVAVRSLRFLVVGDVALAETIRTALTAWAPKIEHCHDEGEAERLFHLALGRDEPWHVVVLDAQMPHAGAVAFGATLRGRATLLVALPTRALADVGNLVEEINATPLLLPVTTASLYAALERSLDPVGGRPPPLPDELPDLAGRVAHVAADDDDASTLLRAFLDRTGLEVHVHRTTAALLAAVTERPQRVGLVVCDVELEAGGAVPRKRTSAPRGAVAVLEALQRDPRAADIPVVALTGSSDAVVLDEVRGRGFAAVLQKPFTRSTLVDLVTRLARPGESARPATSLSPQQVQLEARMALARRDHRALELLAKKLPDSARKRLEAAARRKDDAAVRAVLRDLDAPAAAVVEVGADVDDAVRALLPDYLSRRAQDARDIADAVASGRFDHIAFMGKKMAGTAGAFGMPRLVEIGRQLAVAGKRRDTAEVALVLRRLQDLLSGLTTTMAPR